MPNPICDKCVPNKPEVHDDLVETSGCSMEYEAVKACMKEMNGNVSSCKDQWNTFRQCHGTSKTTSLAKSK